MSGRGFRPVRDRGERVTAVINGVQRELPGGMSVLAALLCADGAHDAREKAPDWFCAIGQCQRCRVRVNHREVLACQTPIAAGDIIETGGDWSG